MDLAWIHWNTFLLGLLCAYVLPWAVIIAVAGACFAIRDARAGRERRRLMRALTEPGVPPQGVRAALTKQQQWRDAAAVDALLRSLERSS